MTTIPSPAEQYAASRSRTSHPRLQAFRSGLRFDLDPFQLASCASLEEGNSVLVAAPTGAGKTIVAEFAVFLAMQEPRAKVFYTAPMKALSNQKFQELVAEYGPESVGLLTGDTNVNAQARIVVMTTEVLRNMLYADSDLLTNLAFVIMDEVHYLADRFRGAVWEEVIIHLPQSVRMIALSATVSNAEEFGDWLQAVRGGTDVIVSEERPVPLEQHVLVKSKMIDLFDSSGLGQDHRVNPELVQLARSGQRSLGDRSSSRRRGSDRGSYLDRAQADAGRMDRSEIVRMLDGKHLLPAIFFIFSRVGCDQAVRQVLRAGVRLTDAREREEIRRIVDERCRTLLDEDLGVLGYFEWLDGLERGVAAHHAGLLPAFKEVVEELFQKKLVKAVFATETLALGINMPARTVVLDKLEKFNGEARVPITPGEYTQLTGRAGRRGIDVEGHSVIQWAQGLDPQAVASLASRRTYPLNSSFKPTYNMAVNLIDQFGRERTREVLESSFAQFQADRAVVDLARKVRQQEESLAGFATSMTCHLGDFADYSSIRRSLTALERGGDGVEHASRGERERRQRELQSLRKRLKAHSCHNCPEREQHARWAERWWKLTRETDVLSRQISSRTGAIARIFDRVTDVLLGYGYLENDEAGAVRLSESGRILRRIYADRDLLVAEALRQGIWSELDPAGLAAMACALVFEPRREEGLINERYLPRGTFMPALDRTHELWSRLDDLERDNKLPGSNPLALGLSLAMWKWARGGALTDVLAEAEMAAGDFVRWTKQTIDLLDQLSVVADDPVGRTARQAMDAVRRGIVAYSSVA
ncbi:ATP-dependent RNA helicase HelY [Cryobacterium psychrotolerans]|uniref:ATP-dependent RNA helicase HelY n=1 Tax=Cryobacterium psychrotolerans TaxID=386301 RepID=A0A1G8ZHL1_9MICO|nr:MULTISPECIES: DEAD/DEAH box helicase [Cryobacterium]TFD48107.1 DEAD/DEAH box helicase [Cryobacterium sp. TMT1-2-1]TFD87543.1 DEAD/DEAH box helicase [Cryobacterium psychrotolerans]SDK14612.1 ATP-dependent RNA helicase HelY [Cryobacterium psychrotolerans]